MRLTGLKVNVYKIIKKIDEMFADIENHFHEYYLRREISKKEGKMIVDYIAEKFKVKAYI